MRKQSGLGLIELLVVLLIISILAAGVLMRQDNGDAMRRLNAAHGVVNLVSVARLRAVQTECPVTVEVSAQSLTASYFPGCHAQGSVLAASGETLTIAFDEGQFFASQNALTLTADGRLTPANQYVDVMLDGALRVDLDTLTIQ